MGVTRVSIVKTLSGNPTLDTLQRIATALDVDLLDLFEDNRKKNTSITCPKCGTSVNIKVEEKK